MTPRDSRGDDDIMDTTDIESPQGVAVWRRMPPDLRLQAAGAFFEAEGLAAEKALATGLIARQINFRPKSVRALPAARRAHHLAALRGMTDALAGQALVALHLAHRRPLMSRFLDLLGLAHEEGLIEAEIAAPPAGALAEAVGTLRSEFPAGEVELYLETLLMQDAETWGAVASELDREVELG